MYVEEAYLNLIVGLFRFALINNSIRNFFPTLYSVKALSTLVVKAKLYL